MAKFAQDDKLEQLNQQKRRMKQLEHKRAADQLVEQRKEAARKSAEVLLAEREHLAEMEQFKEEVVEQERQRILREHASKLVGFLPKVQSNNTGSS